MSGIGFLGFGEAGSAIAGGLKDAGATALTAYDIASNTDPRIPRRAEETGVRLVETPAELAASGETIISAVVCSEAEKAAESIRAHLRVDHLYVDINSVAPEVKKRIGSTFSGGSIPYVDVAVMTNISRDLSTIPMLLAGPWTEVFDTRFAFAPLDARVVSTEVGEAARIKMYRSLFVKGLEAIALEGMLAAYKAGAHDEVLASLENTFGKYGFPELIQHLIERHAVHGRRRADELNHVAVALAEVGVSPIMAVAGAERMMWDVDRHLQDQFTSGTDPEWIAVLDAMSSLDEPGAHSDV